jgi:hypothetical protein
MLGVADSVLRIGPAGMQAEDHLGRLPPSRHTPAGIYAGRPGRASRRLAGSHQPTQAGRAVVGPFTG